jgi:hypothetical protein
MADKKISALTGASTPLDGTEVLPIVKSGATVKVAVSDLTAGRAISATAVTASTGNFVVGTSGQGVDFSATSGTGTSELLSDYEEGTFTPVATQATSAPTLTYTERSGKYVKIGRVVVAHLEIIINAISVAGSGATQITGLPFTIAENNYGGQGSFGFNDALANTVYGCWCTGTTAYFRSGARSSGNDSGGWSAGGYLGLTIVYQV